MNDDRRGMVDISGWQVDGTSLAGRPFVGWDGEGITFPGDIAQSYVLFGASSSPEHRIISQSLSTVECLELLLSVEREIPDALHVGFGFGYDVNMILRDVPYDMLERLYGTGHVTWNGYRLHWLPGKWFNVKQGTTTLRVFEAFGFFQSSFLIACEKFLGEDDPLLVTIREGKQRRRSFTFDELDTVIIPYWETELQLFVRLMNTLRRDLVGAGFKLHSWHGPGAVANTVLKSRGVREHLQDTPELVNRAAQYAYAGGRFELFRCGHHPGKVWQYDINSAYPAAIAQLPSLADVEWEYTETFDADTFGVWYVEHTSSATPERMFNDPGPVFYRDPRGHVSFPPMVAGWYWTPEAELISDEVRHGWVARHEGLLPFSWVPEMYAQRAAWKHEGNSSERALKLALNSLYGKMAQRAGWKPGGKIPVWHQLEWAGWVTAATRRKIWDAIAENPDAVIAAETDAVFTTEPLHGLDLGSDLGQWSETTYDWLTYVQSGLWFGMLKGKIVEKYRGFDKGSLPHSRVLEHLADPSTTLYGDTTRFIGLGIALNTNAVWRSWITGPRSIRIGGGGKRAHLPATCHECQNEIPLTEQLHSLSIITSGGRSQPHSLPWNQIVPPALRTDDQIASWQ